MQAAPPAPSGLLAGIDMGSNSFRLEIGQVRHGRYLRIDYLKETVRLGAGLDGQGLLTEEAAQRGLQCLRRFAQRLSGFKPSQVRAVATQTLREARNRDAFLLRAIEALGFAIEVISGREEARLIYSGVSFLQPSATSRLVVDIGGRSTEMILGRARTVRAAESFKVGCVSLSLRYFPEGRITEAGFRAALGSSGTAGAVSQLLAANNITDGSITPEGLRWCIERCIAAGQIDRIDLPGLKPERRAVLPGGLAILYTLAVHFGIERLQPAKGALRQGVIIDLHERLEAARRAHPTDLRDETVHELQRRFMVDSAQSNRVRDVALVLYRGLHPRGNGESLRELGWACDLHELGMMVSHHDHHRHSAYLLAHVDAAGFSQSQQRGIGELVLGQRGGLRKIEFSLANEEFRKQVLCLRLGVIKCHARGEVDAQALQLSNGGRRALLQFSDEWAGTHPRTLHLLREEALVWERSGLLELGLPVTA
jgi:exopolyphosphatase / guanosine-5'-triphosphate,3'-diphosphate pyrophosphatase